MVQHTYTKEVRKIMKQQREGGVTKSAITALKGRESAGLMYGMSEDRNVAEMRTTGQAD